MDNRPELDKCDVIALWFYGFAVACLGLIGWIVWRLLT